MYREAQFYLVSVAVLMLVLSLSVIYGGAPSTIAPSGREMFTGSFTRTLAIFPLLLYGLYLFIQFEEVKRQRPNHPRQAGDSGVEGVGDCSRLHPADPRGSGGAASCGHRARGHAPDAHVLWGMTIVAAATSVPDTFVSVRASVMGRSQSSVSNVLGSNVFDLLVAVPLAVMVTGTIAVNLLRSCP